MPKPTKDARPTEPQVSDLGFKQILVAPQTDSCDSLYINKYTLVAYRIAVVQNTQSLQYEQMQIAFSHSR